MSTLTRPPVQRVPPVARPTRSWRSPVRSALLTGAAGVAAVTTAVLVAPHVPRDPLLHDVALLGHLTALALGFGAVLLLDLTGARWMLGRVTLADTARLAALAHPAIWLGMAGLVLTGGLLHPDPTSVLTQGKLLAVVVACANGGYATSLGHEVATAAARAPHLPRGLLLRGLVASGVSQGAWWTAVVVGWLNARS
ncbi:hypothetical protein [Oryzobacter terrae]|uniref:hypothetical protein n=1 Tax=Oryzobacter terrae TaxID=1620385 RepID=UPI00366FD908